MINKIANLVDVFYKLASPENVLKENIINAAQQGNINNFVKELEKDNVNANIKIGYPSGLKSLIYSELEVSPLQFEQGLGQETLERLKEKYKDVPNDLKTYLTRYKMVPEGGPFIITFP